MPRQHLNYFFSFDGVLMKIYFPSLQWTDVTHD